ncbi:hypothetical protein [Bacillus manliponensis]|uniref:hypothetical protein n=1 Tax=Bacillus manliponensis TaxID=574376 RepID=UPI000AF362F7|nr:hypothetical protein [Bacillus manliponensis]
MTNREAIGYLLLACKEVGVDKDTVMKLRDSMYCQFDIKTEYEAEDEGNNWYSSLEA